MSGSDVRTSARRWWGERWLAVLDDAGPAAARRIQRGHGLARRGAVEDVQVGPGVVTASVTEDRGRPQRVTLRWPEPGDEVWEAAVDALATEVRHVAALLDGDLPVELVAALSDVGLSLLPSLDELSPSCPCPERASWCRHAAAVHVAAGVQLDRDPGVLLRLRGRTRDELLRRVRGHRSGGPEVTGAPPDLTRGLEAAHGDLGSIALHPTPVEDAGSLLRHLGPPPGVEDPEPLVALVERAAAAAWRLAAGDGAAAADEEVMLAELRSRRVASAAMLADALGRDAATVQAELDRLYHAGAVLRTGSGDRARYRAASS